MLHLQLGVYPKKLRYCYGFFLKWQTPLFLGLFCVLGHKNIFGFHQKVNIFLTFTFGDRGPPHPLMDKIPKTDCFCPITTKSDSKSNEL